MARFVCLTLRRPATSTLFPYTTLFRSPRHEVTLNPGEVLFLPSRWWHHVRSLERALSVNFWWAKGWLALVARAAEDRKSTRLNSSHVEISYAVFCLKKITMLGVHPALGREFAPEDGQVCVSDVATTSDIYSLSLHDALPISSSRSDLESGRGAVSPLALVAPRAIARTRAVGQLLVGEGLARAGGARRRRSEEHTSELQSRRDLVCRLLLEKNNHARRAPGARARIRA